ncbi:MAG: primosomal protein N' [Desulfobulbaceae bacterium]|nr:MAG: primosomal protein N' [Desulfobulbaceae bacterium]
MEHLVVAVAAPLFEPLTYAAPDSGLPAVGVRVLVPLGRRRITGYVIGTTPQATTEFRVRPILDVLDREPLFHAGMVPFFRWVADYYQYPIGEVIKSGLPGGLTSRFGRQATLTTTGRQALAPLLAEPPPGTTAWFADLLSNGTLSRTACAKIWRGKGRKILLQWQARGWLEINEVLDKATTKAKTETCLTLHEKDAATPLKKSEEKTLQLIREKMADQPDLVCRRDITKLYTGAAKAIRSLAERGIVSLSERRVYRDPFGERPPFFPRPQELTAEQQAVLEEILPAVAARKFAPFLIHGVTGCGKTEVYLRAAEECLALGRSVLVLVPEIALATQIEGHFVSRFGDRIALLHSGLTTGERFDQWQRISRGQAAIVIGARSAIFAPLLDPGLIIVDEEHDPAYKQDDNLRYNGRDLAVLRARENKAVVLLGSATPAVTSYHNGLHGKFTTLTLTRRIHNRSLPEVEIVDLKKVPTVSEQSPLFSPNLRRALQDTFARGDQALVFLNRRGFANLLLCQDCGHSVSCPHCEVTLTLHKKRNRLICHYCGYEMPSAALCPHCRSPHMRQCGFGTERIEEELRTMVPKATIGRLDRDTTSSSRRQFIDILRAVRNREIDILVGTQMITKGHHFPHVTLVGIIWADTGLALPDFRAAERTFQLLSQVTGRAGRGDKPGKVIIQTFQPDHYAVVAARQHDYHSFYEREIDLRHALDYPPYSRLINIKFSGETDHQVAEAAQACAAQARKNMVGGGVEILGPAPAPLAKLRNRHRWQLLLKGKQPARLAALARFLRENPPAQVRGNHVRMSLDIDPESML